MMVINKRTLQKIVVVSLLLLLLTGMLPAERSEADPSLVTHPSIVVEGKMHYIAIEGGCWVLETSFGKKYQLHGAQVKQLHVPDLKVMVRIIPTPDRYTACQMGESAQLVQILRMTKM
ncbi:hypothetical protein [Mechercharimyces sp. CAU 1602]|uniref:hypothetical protein n=1 Tax=Mechercharimyces sp. CAU 1602 TaxID=2973933 RepID=UPI0021621721|nr:hypothetical protein [Mechercharimyces sp. CAU 1602]